ncbi:hypothetical protein BVI061214_02092 [Thermus aquaticus]|uniref:Uncharacterized protein n=1 Tax=Thermus aquaticus TaxID=271 RepID=A0A0N0BME2_THEAQ|nr:hypothetical protein BVI061214_02092 [Thermus aquaticus]
MNRERERGSVRICGLFFSCLHLLMALLAWGLAEAVDRIVWRKEGR